MPLNTLSPGRDDRAAYEQPGCLHATMDLYKHAFRLSPLVCSDLVADCFVLAWDVREVDMRASPYDFATWASSRSGSRRADGKREYAAHQRAFADRAAPLRDRLVEACDLLSTLLTCTMRAIHHFDLWVQDPATATPEWSWLFTGCGWEADFVEETGGSWKHPDGTYTFLERSPDLLDERHDRLRPGINHLAFTVPDRATLDALRSGGAADTAGPSCTPTSTRTPAATTTPRSTWRTPRASRSRSSSRRDRRAPRPRAAPAAVVTGLDGLLRDPLVEDGRARPPQPAITPDPRWVFYTDDKTWYSSPWFGGKHRIMIPFGCTEAPYYSPDPRCHGRARLPPRHRRRDGVRHQAVRRPAGDRRSTRRRSGRRTARLPCCCAPRSGTW